MKKIIAFVFTLSLTADMSMAQASKPKATTSVQSRVQVTATPMTASTQSSATTTVSSGRTTTGRPADLDPRIPWLDDLGMPQSGGPEPLVKTGEFVMPAKGAVLDLFEYKGDLVMQINGIDRVVLRSASDGKLKWSHVLKEGVGWGIVTDGEMIYCVPASIPEETKVRESILAYDGDGKLIRRIEWPIPSVYEDVGNITFAKGLIIAETSRGRRIHARIDPKSTTDPDDIVTVGDVGVNSEINADEYKKNYKAGYAVLGARLEDESYDPEKARKLNDKHRNRAGKLRGHRIQIGGLPMFDPNAEYGIGDWWKPAIRGGSILAIGEDGSIWEEFAIWNPYRKSFQEMNEATEKDSPNKRTISKSGIALFSPDGKLRGYMLKLEGDSYIYPVGGAAYVKHGDKLVRIEPMHAK